MVSSNLKFSAKRSKKTRSRSPDEFPLMPLAIMTGIFVLLSLIPLQRNYAVHSGLIQATHELEAEVRENIKEYKSLRGKIKALEDGSATLHGSITIHAVVLVRIEPKDKAGWSAQDLKDWMEYLEYAGVSHVYLYDNYVDQSDSLKTFVNDEIKKDFVTYHDWRKRQQNTFERSQASAYTHAREHYKGESDYEMAWNMNEYPFAPNDLDPGFLVRAIARLKREEPNASEFACSKYLFVGEPVEGEQVIERFLRRAPEEGKHLVKSIFDPVDVSPMRQRHERVKGLLVSVDPNVLRINHYSGQQSQDHSPVILENTIPDKSAMYIASRIRRKRRMATTGTAGRF